MASVRPTLLDYSAQLPGSRVLDDHYGANLNRIVILKGNAGRLAYINEFVEQAKASGLVQKAIDHAGPRGVNGGTTGRFELTLGVRPPHNGKDVGLWHLTGRCRRPSFPRT
jgi:hypothetical protein